MIVFSSLWSVNPVELNSSHHRKYRTTERDCQIYVIIGGGDYDENYFRNPS